MAQGRAAREHCPRDSQGDWSLPSDRPDPVEWLRETNTSRLDAFQSVRIGRMVASPFAFLRGAAELMAIDLAGGRTSGILTSAIGDAHLGNFGMYASPERQLVMDVNDFDQAHPGPWEWDVKRLAASIVLAGRQNGLSEKDTTKAVVAMVRQYARSMNRVSQKGVLPFHTEVLDMEDLRQHTERTSLADEIALAERKARSRTQLATIPKFTERQSDGRYRIIEVPPLLIDVTPETAHAVEATQDEIIDALEAYADTLPYEWQRVVRSYAVMDVAYRVTGVGSAGMRTYLALLTGNGHDDAFFLQLKEAGPSVLAGRADAPRSRYAHQGERVVRYQQRSQTVSDPLIGWTTMGGRDYYVRQLRDMKGAIPIEDLDRKEMPIYAQICGALLARAHARAADPARIAGYVGRGAELDQAIARFATAYADQTEADWKAAREAALSGALPYAPDERS